MSRSSKPVQGGRLVVVLGDQLDADSPALARLDLSADRVWMCEAAHESTRTWSAKQRIAVFLSAMRHFRDSLRGIGVRVDYRTLEEVGEAALEAVLLADIERFRPDEVVMTAAGEWGVQRRIEAAVRAAGVRLVTVPDGHFLCTVDEFNRWADGRRQLRMEHFYRYMRQHHRILVESGKPVGGRWNFDADNRKSFGKKGPGVLPVWPVFEPDETTASVVALIERRFADHPGHLDSFRWPVTRAQALTALSRFVDERLASFGVFQDAMWSGQPGLYHSGLSAAMNMKLLSPREVVDAVLAAFDEGRASLSAVEGFIRQIIGWREFIRGVYWRYMPEYEDMNALEASENLPDFYWTGNTTMECLRQALGQTLNFGYAHHIQRLMVTGLYALLLGVAPRQVHQWYLSVYVDAVEWVEMPNTLGMAQYADGGRVASKPYVASGRYIDRMSDYCRHCPFDPTRSAGDEACPFTTLYWDFLDRHEHRFANHPRAAMQWKNLNRLDSRQRAAIRAQAARLRSQSVSTRAATASGARSGPKDVSAAEAG